MIKIQATTEAPPTRRAQKKAGAEASFQPGRTPASNAAAGASAPAPASMMGALIALQSDGGGGAKTLVAAQRTLDLLERLQLQLIDGEASPEQLEALAAAAAQRAHAGADADLLRLYDEIALRARVELAKLGRR